MLVGLATIHFREQRRGQSRVVFTVPRDAAAFPQLNLPVISPDGTRVVFFGPGDGGRRCSGTVRSTLSRRNPLAGTEISSGPPFPFWSPDGRFIGVLLGWKTQDDRRRRRCVSDARARSGRGGWQLGSRTERSFSAPRSVPCTASRLPEGRRPRCASSIVPRRVEASSGLTFCPMENTTCMSRGAAMPKRPAFISARSARRSPACSYVASRTLSTARLAI